MTGKLRSTEYRWNDADRENPKYLEKRCKIPRCTRKVDFLIPHVVILFLSPYIYMRGYLYQVFGRFVIYDSPISVYNLE
jgi:hypothetical protein